MTDVDTGPPFVRGSETSEAAADKIRPVYETERERVFQTLLARGETGATDQELQDDLHMDPSTQRPRRVELVRADKVADSGRTRPTRKGRQAVVWVVKGLASAS